MRTQGNNMNTKNNITGSLTTFFLQHQKIIIVFTVLIILLLPLAFNLFTDTPAIQGNESYYLLNKARQHQLWDIYLIPLWTLTTAPLALIAFIPPLLALVSVLLALSLLKKTQLPPELMQYYFVLVIFSPVFLLKYTTLTIVSLFIFYALLGITLIASANRILKIASIIPFVAAISIDIFHSIILTLIVVVHLFIHRREKTKINYVILMIILMLILIFALPLHQPSIAKPFETQQFLPDLITDFGGHSGVSAFIIILGFIGIFYGWKQKQYAPAYLFLIILFPAYIYNTNIIFLLSLVIIFFASIGLTAMLKKPTALPKIRKFTIFIILLGILFSFLSYANRLQANTLTTDEMKALQWIKENTAEETIIFSIQENTEYLLFFAHRSSFLGSPNIKSQDKKNLTNQIFKAAYITDLFPILEQNNISLIYINKNMRQQLPPESGLLFLLKNERFKLIHSSEDTEVWMFKEELEKNTKPKV